MADARVATLTRVLRVRTLQLNLARADEAAAHARLDGEVALQARIAALAAGVAPRAETEAAALVAAAAGYRERLHAAAVTADTRHADARSVVDRACAATGAARRDQSGIEQLIARGQARAALAERRALEAAAVGPGKRHAPC